MSSDAFRALPAVDELARHPLLRAYENNVGRALVLDAIRAQLDAARAAIRAGQPAPTSAQLVDALIERIERALRPTLTRVVNATGVILHTNLGRAPLSADALQALDDAAASYANLEYALDTGQRGSRYEHAEELVKKLTGAEAALIVNNNAAAVLLILRAFAAGREVIVSRGQLVEIGGGFRVPDVLRESGATMVEVGTTNRTRRADFENALTPNTALLLRVHPSNFRVVGFTQEVSPEEMAALAHQHQLLAVDDVGSGALLDTAAYGLAPEPTPQASLRAGADLVTFSGDKLLGGPQAGILVGKQALVTRLKKHPLTRALRVDKLTLAALHATLLHYLKGEAPQKIPVWQMISAPLETLNQRAEAWRAAWRAAGLDARVVDARSTVGGGSLPGETLPTRAVALYVPSPDAFVRALRVNEPPIIARIENDAVLCDPRTVLPHDETALLEGVARAAHLV